jgi:insertion element IS1 protein InsB
LELDELWSFVFMKSCVRWIWVALCRRTRQVVSFVVGDRIEAACRKLWEQVPETYRATYCYTDFWEAYQNFIPENQQTPYGVDSGMRGSGSGVIMSFKHSLRA